MALHQPFFEVIPVARELISKTKRIASKGVQQSTSTITPRRQKQKKASERLLSKPKGDSGQQHILPSPYTDEPEAMTPPQITRVDGSSSSTSTSHNDSSDRDRTRVTSMFRRNTASHSGKTSGDLISPPRKHREQYQPHDPPPSEQY